MTEYATTKAGNGEYDDDYPPDPVEPDGDGWEIVAMAAADKRLYWTWRRSLPAEPRPGDGEGTP